MKLFSDRFGNLTPIKKLSLALVACVVIIFAALQFTKSVKKKAAPVVVLVRPQEDAEVDEVVRTLKRGLRSLGYSKRRGDIRYKNVRVEDIEGVPNVLRDAMSSRTKIILAFTGPIARTVTEEVGGKIPLIYCLVGEPDLDFINRQEYPPVMGVSIPSLPEEELLDFLHAFLPNCTRVGVVRSLNMSDAELRKLEEVGKARGLQIIALKEGGPDILDFPGKVDCVLITWGVNKGISGEIIKTGLASKVPVFAEDKTLCKKGAIGFSLGCSSVGKHLAEVVDKLLKGKDLPNALKVEETGQPVIYVNLSAAKRFGIEVSVPPLAKPVK